MKRKPIAIVCSDLHLSEQAPKARAENIGDWYSAMERALKKVQLVKDDLHKNTENEIPILYAGDIFDHWKVSPELINFALETLPKGYSIPGQHDLPNHSHELAYKSAYGTLVRAKHLFPLTPKGIDFENGMVAYGFGWEQKLQSPIKRDEEKIHVALIHKYLWTDSWNCHKGAKDTDNVSHLPAATNFYDFLIAGDNHTAFTHKDGVTQIINCGSLMCRSTIQRNHTPSIYILFDDKTFFKSTIDTGQDKWIEEKKKDKTAPELDGLMQAFNNMTISTVTFADELRKYLKDHKLEKKVKQVLREALDKALEKK